MRNDLLQALREVRATYPAIDLLDRERFIANLVFVHNVITATPQLLSVAMNKSHGDLSNYFEAHLEEELNHAAWLAYDLSSAGIDVADMPPSPLAMAMAGSQYYLIYHAEPAALLGYMAALECFPSPLDQVETLERVHGQALCRTLRYHATHDIDHGEDVLDQVDELSPRQFEIVKRNAIQTATYIGAAISEMQGAIK
ncbi:hypothetical protein ABH944_004864 [Caballeronia udeis]|uniref:Iron-containing redox enzyme family protein n=1 Tax=Caballeronia udeis TaxID=1232866 RepID=A0ABW8MMD4_9BURK